MTGDSIDSTSPLVLAGAMSGQTIKERYLLVCLLGTGGWSEVYEAFDKQLSRRVAVKILYQHLTWKSESLKRFQAEAEAAASISHNNVVSIYDVGFLDGGQPFIVMQMVPGSTLKGLLETKGSLEWRQATEIFLAVCEGLNSAHSLGVIHRDIKPSNILIAEDGSIRLTDFGLAKQINAASGASLTQTGETIGTPYYMSPEQCLGEEIDLRSDIYSLGCLMYETLKGHPPFEGNTLFEILLNQVNYLPQPLITKEKKDIPRDFEAIVFKCLRKKNTERYDSVDDLKQDLVKVRDGIPLKIKHMQLGKQAPASFSRRSKVSTRTLLLSLSIGIFVISEVIFTALSGGLYPGIKMPAISAFKVTNGEVNPVRPPGFADLMPQQTMFLPALNTSGILFRRGGVSSTEPGFRTFNYDGMLLNGSNLVSFSASETIDPESDLAQCSITYAGNLSAKFKLPNGKQIILRNIRNIDTVHEENGYFSTTIRCHNSKDCTFATRENAQVDSFSISDI